MTGDGHLPDGPAPRVHRHARTALGVLAGLLFLLFAPLLISFLEFLVFRSTHFEDWCRDIGVHGFYDALYKPLKPLFQKFL